MVNLEDVNDNYPLIPQSDKIMCRDRKPICLTAVDADLPPNTVPFTFEIPDRNLGWRLVENDGMYFIPKMLLLQ